MTSITLRHDASTHGRAALTAPAGRIGPNSVTQLAVALRSLEGEETTRSVFGAAMIDDLLRDPPEKMIDERIPQRLFAAVSEHLPEERAKVVFADAGARTADYVLAHRIPRLAQWILKRLPARPAAALLLRAIERNAWTFAGSGACRVNTGAALGPNALGRIHISQNPLQSPKQIWHVSVFTRLFQTLAAADAKVVYVPAPPDGERYLAAIG